ncbi:MAG: YceI family protein [Wenzhouxiangellaceae bacterium]|nr:YceI family protein [Wenzhouxiangellaceae bacterium]
MNKAGLLSVAGLGLLLAANAGAEECFSGDQQSGYLEFRGAVEGSGFSGRFERFDVRYCMPENDPAAGEIEVRVDLSSADSSNRDRDETLKGEEFFHIEQYPESTWTSTDIKPQGDGFLANGELRLKGSSADQQVEFTLQSDADVRSLRGSFVMLGDAQVDRQRFDVGTGEFADPEFVRNRVDVSFEIELQGVE